jgi:uncharacterized protein (TIGR00369 family)
MVSPPSFCSAVSFIYWDDKKNDCILLRQSCGNEEGNALMDSWARSEPYFALLGYQVEEVRPDFCRMRLPFRPELHQAGGAIHGGFIASLIDTAGIGAVLSKVTPGTATAGSINMTVNYLAAARGVDLTAEARVVRRGRSVVFVDVIVSSPSGEPIAQGLVTYKVGTNRESS